MPLIKSTPTPPEQAPSKQAPVGYAQALVLIVALVCATVLAATGTLDASTTVVLYVIILGAAGAHAAAVRGKLPPAGPAAVVLLGLIGLLGEVVQRWRS